MHKIRKPCEFPISFLFNKAKTRARIGGVINMDGCKNLSINLPYINEKE
jgi:hypothetical protein